jgi:predicted MPP superfamily phosphohydrolase
LPAAWIPFVLGAAGVVQSLWTRVEVVDVVLDGRDAGPLSREPSKALPAGDRRPLRIVQITDPHLGPFMSPRRLRRICERAVQAEPDLVVLTGDFLTMESQREVAPLALALAPLTALPGRVFACLGNHDHEALDLVVRALEQAGVRLLVDQDARLDTPVGPVQIVGSDFHFRQREEKLRALSTRCPRQPDALRLWLLHDPGAFQRIPEGDADLVLSGHTHGGHLGLLSLGLPHTIVSAVTSMPDHGLWSRGRDRLYVHRGTGHYGFPLRLGVPAEESILQVYGPPGKAGPWARVSTT